MHGIARIEWRQHAPRRIREDSSQVCVSSAKKRSSKKGHRRIRRQSTAVELCLLPDVDLHSLFVTLLKRVSFAISFRFADCLLSGTSQFPLLLVDSAVCSFLLFEVNETPD
jgi:hypothetical protein